MTAGDIATVVSNNAKDKSSQSYTMGDMNSAHFRRNSAAPVRLVPDNPFVRIKGSPVD